MRKELSGKEVPEKKKRKPRETRYCYSSVCCCLPTQVSCYVIISYINITSTQFIELRQIPLYTTDFQF